MDYYPFYGTRSYYPVRDVVPTVRHETAPKKKVIQISVTDGSEKQRKTEIRSDSAVKIQKVVRGFLVRKSLKKIAEIRNEVDEIEKRISSDETVELIRRDSKERLRINEMIMRLLLKLDSVRGFDSGVRDCRKKVIKKAIRLQEIVDSICDQLMDDSSTVSNSALYSNSNSNTVESVPDADRENKCGSSADSNSNSLYLVPDVDRNLDLVNNCESVTHNSNSNSVDSVPEVGGEYKSSSSADSNSNCLETVPDVDPKLELEKNCESLTDTENPVEDEGENRENVELDENECAETMELSQDESQTGSSANPEEDESDGDTPEKHENGGEIEQAQECGKEKEVNEKSIQLVEKLVKDNERMMGLMADLFRRNEMQTLLLSSLSQRVEHLERAFMCERSRRRKKKKNCLGNLDKDKFN